MEPTTIRELMSGKGWNSTLKLLRQNGATITVAVGERCGNEGTNVVLTGEGFKVLVGTLTPSTLFVQDQCASKVLHTPAEVLRKVRECEPDFNETEFVAGINRHITRMCQPATTTS